MGHALQPIPDPQSLGISIYVRFSHVLGNEPVPGVWDFVQLLYALCLAFHKRLRCCIHYQYSESYECMHSVCGVR